MSRRSRHSHQFAFQRPEELTYEELNFARYEETLDQMTVDLIRDYIQSEASAVEAEQENNKGEFEKEEKGMQELLDNLNAEADALDARSKTAREKQEQANELIEMKQKEIDSIKGSDNEQKALISDLKGLIQEMVEQKNKDVKACDEKNMKSIIAKMQSPDGASKEQRYIMDSLAKLFSGDQSATFDSKFDDYFSDSQAFGSNVRRARPERLEKDLVKEIAYRVNQDSEGKVGDIQTFILESDHAPQNVDFYVHFKILFKLTQMSLTIKKKDQLMKKQHSNDSSIAMIATDIETQQTIAKNLDFCSELAEEAARMRAEEIAALQHKHDMLKGELKKFQDVNFTQEYFQELLN